MTCYYRITFDTPNINTYGCLLVCLRFFVYSHCTLQEKKKKIKTFFKRTSCNNKKSDGHLIFSCCFRSIQLLRSFFPPTAPVKSIYCLLSNQCDIHNSLPIITNSTRRVHKRDKRAPEQPIRGWLSQQRTTLKDMSSGERGQGSARIEANLRDTDTERKWFN